MPKNITKTRVNKIKREKAIKKSKRKKAIAATILVLVTLGAIGYLVYTSNQQNSAGADGNAEVYSHWGQTVRLLPDGTFNAVLAHRVRKNGTYTKTTEDDRVTVSFYVNGREEIGSIVNNILYMPGEWDDGHGHGNALRRVNQ
jgi:hypothetical protein